MSIFGKCSRSSFFNESEFNETIKDVKRRWTQDLLDKNYSLTDLISTTSKTYNNIVTDEG